MSNEEKKVWYVLVNARFKNTSAMYYAVFPIFSEELAKTIMSREKNKDTTLSADIKEFGGFLALPMYTLETLYPDLVEKNASL